MPSFDRDKALKNAEKALRQGRIEAAIAEYLRVVEAQPRDWNSANALGDLYVRAGQADLGIAQFARVADHLALEGFHLKAAALFKKILKLRPDDEYALLQSAEIAVLQGTLAEAKQYFQAVATRRRDRGDAKGAAQARIRLGTLDPEDLEGRLGAAAAAKEIGDATTALREYREVAAKLDRHGRHADALAAFQSAFDLDQTDDLVRARLFAGYLDSGALPAAREVARGAEELRRVAAVLDAAGQNDSVLEVLADIVAVDPEDVESRARLTKSYTAAGDLERARTFLSPEAAGRNASLWLLLGEVDLRGGHLSDGRAAIAEALTLDQTETAAALALGCRLAEWSPAAGYECVDAVADSALGRGDFEGAAAALGEFASRVPGHIVALMRLVEVCVDGGLASGLLDAQARLADAYLDVGRGLEARIISEDLVAHDPRNRAHLERYRRALVLAGESDPDRVIAERLSGENPFFTLDDLDLNDGTSFDAAASGPPAPQPGEASLERVFRELRNEAESEVEDREAAEQHALALTYLDMGMVEDATRALQVAARSPRERFAAASTLGRLSLEAQEPKIAVEWFEQALQAPASSVESRRSVRYDLAAALESMGDGSRALALFSELAAEPGAYRDATDRVARLSNLPRGG